MTSANNEPGLADQAAERIRQKLITAEWVPGQQLSEAAVSEMLSISRNTLRECFRVLIQEGLLVHKPHRGVFVSEPSLASIIDIYRVRRIIEGQALMRALPGHPAGERMHACVARAQACRGMADWVGVGTANMEFHAAIVSLADSERLDRWYAHLCAELRLAFGLLSDPEFLHGPYVERNHAIAQHYVNGQVGLAAQALDDYLALSERTVLAAYARLKG